MHGYSSGFVPVVNAELDFMGGVGISSTPSPQQSSDLEKTQAELRQTFTAAEKFRRELEFLQKGGDPLDLKPGNVASVSFQSTSLTDRHPEQFVTSEAKGSFAINASPHGDSVESSDRLGAPSVCEPNSADNLMLLKESGDSAVLELPKKSYKRRIRSRPNRDGARSSSTDVVPSRGGHFLPFRHASNHNPKSPNASVAQNSTRHLESELDGTQSVQSTLGPAHGPYSAVLEANDLQNAQVNHHDLPVKSDGQEKETSLTPASIQPESVGHVEHAHLSESNCATNGIGNIAEMNSISEPTKVLDAESSCTQTSQRFDDCNGNGLCTTVPMEQNLEGSELGAENNDKILNDKLLNVDIANEDGSAIKDEEGLKGSESTKGVGSDSCTDLKTERKPSPVVGPTSISQDNPLFQEDTLSLRHSTDRAEGNACSQDNLKPVTKEHEDSILEEARIIEAKRTRIAELIVRTLPLERRIKSQWDFVLEEMSWLANDFAQERLWKLTAAAQISRRVVFASRTRIQQQRSLQKQKEASRTLAETVMQFWHMIQVKCKGPDSHCLKKDHAVGIQGYAMRFLEYNSSQAQCNTTQPPAIPYNISELDIMDLSWEDNLTEENLFYTVPPGAIEAYRKAIDSHLLNFERTGSSVQEEVDTSCYDAVADNTFEEDEGETSTYYLSGGFESRKSPKSAQKGRKNIKLYGPRSYEMGGDLTFGTQPSVLNGKRPGSSLNVAIPTKRVRTASRQRIISPFTAGTSGHLLVPNRTDASSGDNNSFQDEQSTLHGGPQIPNNMEAESVGDYEKQLQFDSMEVSNRPKKKKKAKHPGSMFEHRWQLDSNFQNDQKDHSRRRPDAHQFDSNGSSAASQMSNMSNPNKFMKLLVRDRSRKVKAPKTPVGQPGSGSPWSLFEDQALVVLVHDMGPNWELISDAINSTLQFKCIFRKSKECKERHKILMDRNGDGADSAEDSGSSQPYPSTLPGIPEGSARQLFQRLQGPMEEDTLKTHFEKIIMIGQKQHYRRFQNDNQDPKQLQQPHSSHAFALSQVCPNNLNGGPVLTPLELCEAISSSPDVVPVGYQGPHTSGLPVVNHGSGSTSSAPGSSNSLPGSNIPSTSGPLNPSVRDGRYGIPRTGSLSADDQQRIQQYNQMLSARNAQQSSLPPGSHSVTDRGVRMLPAGNGLGVMCGINRNMKMARPSMLNPGTATSSSMLRPRDPMHMIRPNQNTDQQVSQSGPTQGVPAFGSVTSSSLPNQISQPRTISPQQYPHHFQGPPNHPNPAYAMRLAKERQLQQQRLIQQQQQFATSNPMMPNVQSQESQLPVSSSAQNSKHPVAPPHGLVNNPQTSGNQIVKQPKQRSSQQFQQLQQRQQAPQQQPAKLMKGGRGNMTMHQNLPTDSSLVNGFSGSQSTTDKGPQSGLGNLYPGSSSGKQSVHHPSLNQLPQNHVSSTLQKLANQKQATTQKLLLNRKPNTSDQPTSNSQPSTNVSMPNSTKTDSPAVSLAAQPDSTETSGAGTETEPYGPGINQAMVNNQSSSNSLPNPVGNDAGVQWQPPS